MSLLLKEMKRQMNRVEMFTADTITALQTVINLWCSNEELSPISISIMRDGLLYVAAVVVRECEYD